MLIIAVFGAVGAVARNGLDGWIADRTGGAFPWGTLVINASGCFALGVLFTLLTERFSVDPALRFGVTTGFLGSYTTFSTFSLETIRLLEGGSIVLGVANVLLSLGLGLAFVYAGIVLGRLLT
jgi:CrcB protein